MSAEAHRLTFCWENLGIFFLVPSVTDLLISSLQVFQLNDENYPWLMFFPGMLCLTMMALLRS